MGLKKFELIELEESLKEAKIPNQIEDLKQKYIKWTKEAKELKEKFESEFSKEKTELIIEKMKIIKILNCDDSFFKNGGLLVGFDESQQSKIGTYARISCFKFGESQVWFEDGKYKFRDYMYKPMMGYLEDSYQKVRAYKKAINNFVKNLEHEFQGTPLLSSVIKIKDWYEKIFPYDINDEWDRNMPTVGHVADRIRTADELICTILRMKKIKSDFPNREIIFLGDGIAAFRSHIFPPSVFIKFFLKFLKYYDLNYYAFSKTCRLREKTTRALILPIISAISFEPPLDGGPFIVEMSQAHSESNSHLVRLIKRKMPALRFDVPKDINLNGAISIIKRLIPFSPLGYPLCLEHAHNASSLTRLEWRILDVKYLGAQEDPSTKNLVLNLRKYVLPSMK